MKKICMMLLCTIPLYGQAQTDSATASFTVALDSLRSYAKHSLIPKIPLLKPIADFDVVAVTAIKPDRYAPVVYSLNNQFPIQKRILPIFLEDTTNFVVYVDPKSDDVIYKTSFARTSSPAILSAVLFQEYYKKYVIVPQGYLDEDQQMRIKLSMLTITQYYLSHYYQLGRGGAVPATDREYYDSIVFQSQQLLSQMTHALN